MGDNGHSFRIFGLQRSGNHAIISWLRRNVGLEGSVFFNNCRPGDPSRGFLQVEVKAGAMRPRLRDTDSYDEFVESFVDCRDVLVSYENKLPPEGDAAEALTDFRGITEWKDIAITRGFLNWFASYYRLRIGRVTDVAERDNKAVHSLQLLSGYRDFLNRCQRGGVTVIDYDQWIMDEGYRTGRLAELSLEVKDNAIGGRTNYGGGSSFDGRQAEVDPAKQLNRWSQLGEDGMFQALLRCAARMDSLTEAVAVAYPADAEVLKGLVAGQSLEELALRAVA